MITMLLDIQTNNLVSRFQDFSRFQDLEIK